MTSPLQRGKESESGRIGRLYELQVYEELKRILPSTVSISHGQWFCYRDKNGKGIAQLDFLLMEVNQTYIIEAKVTQTQDAEEQLKWLYRPLVEFLTKISVLLINVCKNMVEVPDKEKLITHPLSAQDDGAIYLWHFNPLLKRHY